MTITRWQKISVWFIVTFVPITLPFWYNLSQMLTRRRYITFPRVSSTIEIIQALDSSKGWTADPIKGVLDIMYHPSRLQHHIDTKTLLGDCDDYSAYTAHQLLASKLATQVWCGSIQFLRDGKMAGHVLTIFVGNDSVPKWMDYYDAAAFDGEWGWAQAAAAQFGGTLLCATKTKVKGLSKHGRIRLGSGTSKRFS